MQTPAEPRSRARAWLFLCALALLGGCFPGYLRVVLTGGADINQGRPLQVLIRTVDQTQYRAESHAEVSALVIRPDASVLKTLFIDPRPKYARGLWIKIAKEKPVAFYFLYTSPSATWKLWLPSALPWRIRIPLGSGGVNSNAVRECRLLR